MMNKNGEAMEWAEELELIRAQIFSQKITGSAEVEGKEAVEDKECMYLKNSHNRSNEISCLAMLYTVHHS